MVAKVGPRLNPYVASESCLPDLFKPISEPEKSRFLARFLLCPSLHPISSLPGPAVSRRSNHMSCGKLGEKCVAPANGYKPIAFETCEFHQSPFRQKASPFYSTHHVIAENAISG